MSNPANIFLNLQNTTNSVQQVSLFNPNPGLTGTGQGSVISTQYSADLSGELNNGNTAFVVAKQVNESSFTTYRVYNANYAPFTTAQQVADALNTLNIGFFSTDVTNPNLLVSFSNNYVYQSMGLEFYALFTINAIGGISYNFDVNFSAFTDMQVNWGDNTIENFTGDTVYTPTHNYAVSGNYNIGIIPAVESNLDGITFQTVPIISILNVDYFSNFLSLTIENSNNFQSINNIQFSNSITTLLLQNNSLNQLFTIPINIETLSLNLNNLSTNDVSNILVQLVNNGINNGTVDVSSQTPLAPLNASGIAAKSTLLLRGWVVTND